MSRTIKRILSLLLCAALLLGAAPLNGFVGLRLLSLSSFLSTLAHAADTSGTCGSNLTWEYNKSSATLTISGNGMMDHYSCEKIYSGSVVTTAPWQRYYQTMKVAVINNGVTNIGIEAFYGCVGLTSVTIGDSVTSIASCAFYGCTKLKSVTIPNSVHDICNSAFYNCYSIESVSIGNGVVNIGANAFENCGMLTELTIGSSVTNIGNSAFSNCTDLTEINYNAQNAADLSNDSKIFSYSGDGITVRFGEEVERIPARLFGKGNAASSPQIESVIIGDSIKSIGDNAFEYCSALRNVFIGDLAAWCSISFSNYLSNPLFYARNLYINNELTTDLVIPNSVTSIGKYAFYGFVGLQGVTIGNKVESVGSFAFYNCVKMTRLTIGDGIKDFEKSAFSGCAGLTEINYYAIDADNISFDSNVFLNAGKNGDGITVTFGDSVRRIPNNLFCTSNSSNSPKIKSVVISNNVTSIGSYAFYNCNNLTSIFIGNNVTSIGSSAFRECTNLTRIEYNAINVTDLTSVSNVFYHAGRIDAGIAVVFGDEVERIPAYLFYVEDSRYRPTINSVTIGDYTTSIGNYAFGNCTLLTNINISDNVTCIGDFAFSNCTKLTSVEISNSVTSIGSYAFNNCTGLVNVTIGNSVLSIGDFAFFACKKLKSVIIGNSVTSIGNYAFYNCYDLTYITLPNVVKSIGDHAFSYCGLTSITIPDSVTSIGQYAFLSCVELTSATIGVGVTRIGQMAFSSCTKLTEINYNAKCVSDLLSAEAFHSAGKAGSGISIVFGDSVETIPSSLFWTSTSDCWPKISSVTIGRNVKDIGNYAFDKCESISDVYYSGTRQQWNEIVIGFNNYYLLNATIHFHEHSYADNVITPPTCTTNGYTTHVCTCGEVIVDTYIVPLGHDFDNWTNVFAPSCLEAGMDERCCRRCNAVETRNVSAFGHTESSWETIKEPTAAEAGIAVKKCTKCSAVLEEKTLPKLVLLKSVTIDDATIDYKASTTLKPSIAIADGVNYAIKYTSSNPNVVSVDDNGKVTGIRKGTTTVTCTVTDEYGNTVKDTCKVTVNYTTWQWLIIILLFGWIWYK